MLYRPVDERTIQMTTDLMKFASDGKSAILTRTFHWALYKVKDPAFMALDRNNEAERQAFWFIGLDRITVLWILKYIRDGLDFEWLIEAADRYDSVRGRYPVTDQQQAKHVLNMLKLQLVHAADAVFLYVIDAKPDDDMVLPIRESGLASAAGY